MHISIPTPRTLACSHRSRAPTEQRCWDRGHGATRPVERVGVEAVVDGPPFSGMPMNGPDTPFVYRSFDTGGAGGCQPWTRARNRSRR